MRGDTAVTAAQAAAAAAAAAEAAAEAVLNNSEPEEGQGRKRVNNNGDRILLGSEITWHEKKDHQPLFYPESGI